METERDQESAGPGQGGADALVARAMDALLPDAGGPRDYLQAHRLLAEAGNLGSMDALHLRASLIATGTGVKADSGAALTLVRQAAQAGDPLARIQLIVLSRLAELPIPPAEPLNAEPLIAIRRDFLGKGDCGYLMNIAEPRFEPSIIRDPATGEQRPDPVRTSDGMSFGPTNEDIVVHAINHRIATATGTPYSHGEPLHMLRYCGGQEYKPHGDALPGSGNLRHWTVLLYLNDDYDGGETEFPRLGVKVKGNAGDMLAFCNVDSNGQANILSQHAGLPVTRGTKYIATRWIREKPYHPWS